MLDADGYPTPASLRALRRYDPLHEPLDGFLTLLREIWYLGGFKLEGDKLELHTGGWSGNEDVIEALQPRRPRNVNFWYLSWEWAKRGGHYGFGLSQLRQLEREREASNLTS